MQNLHKEKRAKQLKEACIKRLLYHNFSYYEVLRILKWRPDEILGYCKKLKKKGR